MSKKKDEISTSIAFKREFYKKVKIYATENNTTVKALIKKALIKEMEGDK